MNDLFPQTVRPSARVLIDNSPDMEFDYAIPDGLSEKIVVGARVQVPLRKGTATGTVTMLPDKPPVKKDGSAVSLKEIGGVLSDHPMLTPGLVRLARWIGTYYSATVESAVRSMVPESVRGEGRPAHKMRKQLRLKDLPSEEQLDELRRKAKRQASILEALIGIVEEKGPEAGLPLAEVASAAAAVKSLQDKGFIVIEDAVVERDPYADEIFVATDALTLNGEQELAVDKIMAAIDRPTEPETLPILLHGITGSGKTEVYLQAVEHALLRGKSAIVLVPEISLTPQTVDRFKSRFSAGKWEKAGVAVLHSHLSSGERHDEWHKVRRQEARIVVGARSAIFAPLNDLGLIIVDEEHEPSYKQDSVPRYNARDIAVVRAKMEGCAVVLGSATPSLETYANYQAGKYERLELAERADNRVLPLVRVVDLRTESRKLRAKGGKGPSSISEPLRIAMNQRIDRGEQTILFINRRGYSSSLTCTACGHVCECPHCSVSLTFHKRDDRMVCHLCGFRAIAPSKCPAPDCRDPSIRFAGFGTERAEEHLRLAFGHARIARVDADTMSRKNQLRDTLNQFKAQKIDILVGTQMIAKGLDFPNVTLVGVLNADLGLHVPDFRAGERTFQLLTQVAGRAGRGETKGEVLVQTFTPHSPAIQFARHHDYSGFAEQELEFRKGFGFPPYTHCVIITTRGPHEERTGFTLETFHRRLIKALGARVAAGDVRIGEPAPAPIAKMQDMFRFQLLLRCANVRTLTAALRWVQEKTPIEKEIVLTIDVDPLNLM
ncbi:primosomal protein N' [Verrucomicrobiales bacterium]|nr:primosomal protein N' [Verrucomicrobiales bacterium]